MHTFTGFVTASHLLVTRFTIWAEHVTWIMEAFALPSGGLSPPSILTRTHVGSSRLHIKFGSFEKVHVPNFGHAAAVDTEISVRGYDVNSNLSVIFNICLLRDGEITISDPIPLPDPFSSDWYYTDSPAHYNAIRTARAMDQRKNIFPVGDIRQIEVYSLEYNGSTVSSLQAPRVFDVPADIHCNKGRIVRFDAVRGRFVLQSDRSPRELHILDVLGPSAFDMVRLPFAVSFKLYTIRRFPTFPTFSVVEFGRNSARNFPRNRKAFGGSSDCADDLCQCVSSWVTEFASTRLVFEAILELMIDPVRVLERTRPRSSSGVYRT